jgi:hypothetical protein
MVIGVSRWRGFVFKEVVYMSSYKKQRALDKNVGAGSRKN